MIIKKIVTPKDLEAIDFDEAIDVAMHGFIGEIFGIFHGRFGSTGFITVEELVTHPEQKLGKVKYDWTADGCLHRVSAPDYHLSEFERQRYKILLRELSKEIAIA